MSESKVISRIVGGLGNQLFCYAAARRLALANDAELVIDNVSGFVRDQAYRRAYALNHFNIPCRKATPAEKLEPMSRIRRYVKRRINMYRPFEKRSYIQQEGTEFDPRLLEFEVRGTVYLEGYWQSEDYFKDVESTIRSDLRMPEPEDIENRTLSAEMRERPSVVVHVRFFDPPGKDGPNNVSPKYYERAVAYMEQAEPDAHYYLFSDHPEAARSLIPLPHRRVTVVSHNKGDTASHADLWLQMQCRHFIIANSTFSWWGAWLSQWPGKQIVAPAQVIGGDKNITSWGFRGLLPPDWIKL